MTMLQYNISGIAPSEVFMLQRDSDQIDTGQFDRFTVISAGRGTHTITWPRCRGEARQSP